MHQKLLYRLYFSARRPRNNFLFRQCIGSTKYGRCGQKRVPRDAGITSVDQDGLMSLIFSDWLECQMAPRLKKLERNKFGYVIVWPLTNLTFTKTMMLKPNNINLLTAKSHSYSVFQSNLIRFSKETRNLSINVFGSSNLTSTSSSIFLFTESTSLRNISYIISCINPPTHIHIISWIPNCTIFLFRLKQLGGNLKGAKVIQFYLQYEFQNKWSCRLHIQISHRNHSMTKDINFFNKDVGNCNA